MTFGMCDVVRGYDIKYNDPDKADVSSGQWCSGLWLDPLTLRGLQDLPPPDERPAFPALQCGDHSREGRRKAVADLGAVSHSCQLIEGLSQSPREFYSALEGALAKREIPDVSISRVEHPEGGGVSSGSRLYVRVIRKKLTIDICAAPFGRGFFVSSWTTTAAKGGLFGLALAAFLAVLVTYLTIQVTGFFLGIFVALILVPAAFVGLGYFIRNADLEEYVFGIPVLGRLYIRFFKPFTYYQQDTEAVFQAAVKAAVDETVQGSTSAKGIRALAEEPRTSPVASLLTPVA